VSPACTVAATRPSAGFSFDVFGAILVSIDRWGQCHSQSGRAVLLQLGLAHNAHRQAEPTVFPYQVPTRPAFRFADWPLPLFRTQALTGVRCHHTSPTGTPNSPSRSAGAWLLAAQGRTLGFGYKPDIPEPHFVFDVSLSSFDNLPSHLLDLTHVTIMSHPNINSHGTQPPPPPQSHTQLSSYTGHPLPRRSSPANSITLRHHKLARDASHRANPGASGRDRSTNTSSSPRRNSSGESYETGNSDPKKWFDQSNQNPTATFDHNVMDGMVTSHLI
jgi:hypothetical protein